MSRKPRMEEAGAIHHVYARGVRAAAIFHDSRDRRHYLKLLGEAVERCRWLCLGYCLMTNHVHLVVETPEPNLGWGMQRLHGAYGTWLNERHGPGGHVFQGRYGSRRIRDDVHLITAVRYLDTNPVEAGLAARPEDWPWCGRGASPPPRWLARERWRELLKEGV